jgi:NAD(P)-dependent dehydrogenase (short-subunit alcohol dehydrogenase family)
MAKPKSVIVTGSTSGIGLGVAEGFAKAGMNIVMNGFGDPDHIETTRAGLSAAYGVEVRYHGADMTKPEEIRAMVDETSAAFDGVDILVNNAGIQHVSPIEDFPEAKWDAIVAINLSSSFHTIKAVFPGMKEKGRGRIINVASAPALAPDIASIATPSSSSSRSTTPQVTAPCAPPPWRARLIGLGVGITSPPSRRRSASQSRLSATRRRKTKRRPKPPLAQR